MGRSAAEAGVHSQSHPEETDSALRGFPHFRKTCGAPSDHRSARGEGSNEGPCYPAQTAKPTSTVDAALIPAPS